MNQVIVWTLAVLIFALLAVWIVRPLLQTRAHVAREISPRDEEIDRLIEEKTAVYRAMLDLEFDHRVGKVSDSDFSIMRKQHESDAINLLRRLDAAASKEVLVDVLEREIASARRRIATPAETEPEESS